VLSATVSEPRIRVGEWGQPSVNLITCRAIVPRPTPRHSVPANLTSRGRAATRRRALQRAHNRCILPGVDESELASAPVKRRQHISRSLIERMRASLTCDILRGLIRPEELGDRLCGRELISQSVRLLIAGFETAIGVIGNGIRSHVTRRGQTCRYGADRRQCSSSTQSSKTHQSSIGASIK
jgi:hypothetical protein